LAPAISRLKSEPNLKLKIITKFFSESWDDQERVPNYVYEALCSDMNDYLDPTYQDRHPGIIAVLCCMQRLALEPQVKDVTVKVTFAAAQASHQSLLQQYIPFLWALAEVLGKLNLMHCYHFQMMFRHILNAFVDSCAKQKPTAAVHDWCRKPCGCGCPPCTSLDSLLVSPDKLSFDFYRTNEELLHLEDRLRFSYSAAGLIAAFRNDTGQDPCLLVTKVDGQYEKKFCEWRQLCTTAKEKIRLMGTDYLHVLLGDCFDNIMSLTPIAIAQPPLPLPAATQAIDLAENDELALQACLNSNLPDFMLSSKPYLDLSVLYQPQAGSAGSIEGLPNISTWRPPLAQKTGNIANNPSGALKRKASSLDGLAGEGVHGSLRTKRPTLDIQLVPKRDMFDGLNVGPGEHIENPLSGE
jgi:hypothetical protein